MESSKNFTKNINKVRESGESNPAFSQHLSLDPSKIENLVKGLERATLRRRDTPSPSVSKMDESFIDYPGVIDNLDKTGLKQEIRAIKRSLEGTSGDPAVIQEGTNTTELAVEEPLVRQDTPETAELDKLAGAFGATGVNRQPKIDFVVLPKDDPRSVLSTYFYPPIPIPGLPDHPPNLFFEVDGQVTEPFLSLSYLRALAKRSPVLPDSEDVETIEDDEFQDSSSSASTSPANSSRSFVCKKCGMTFEYPYKLQRHLAKHSEVKSFTCQNCGKQFKYQTNLKAHQSKVHSDSGAGLARKEDRQVKK